jgi:hypothetical protein
MEESGKISKKLVIKLKPISTLFQQNGIKKAV